MPILKALSILVPGLILLPFLLAAPNRRAGAWLMLAPLALIAAITVGAQWWHPAYLQSGIVGVQSYMSSITQFLPVALRSYLQVDPYFAVIMLASGLCALCLTVGAASRRPAKSLLPLSLAAAALPPAATLLLYTAGDGSRRWGAILSYAVMPMIVTAGLILAGRVCKRHWHWLLFVTALAGWNIVLFFGLHLLTVGAAIVREPAARSAGWGMLFPRFPTFWLGLAAMCLVALPFAATAFLSPPYRERMKSAFGVPAPPAPQEPAAAGTQNASS